MAVRQISGLIILMTFIIWAVWDLYAYALGGQNSTLSVVITDYAYYSPAFPFIVGGIMGHFFFPARGSNG